MQMTPLAWTVLIALIALLGGIAGSALNFSPSGTLLLPAALLVSPITLLLIFVMLRLVYKGRFKTPTDMFSSDHTKPFQYFFAVIGPAAAGFFWFAFLYVTLPFLFTATFGSHYEGTDRVVRIEKCHGRTCMICENYFWLANHGGQGSFCPDQGEVGQLKAGDEVIVSGSISSAGIYLKSFKKTAAQPNAGAR
jgi:hypothetical protein